MLPWGRGGAPIPPTFRRSSPSEKMTPSRDAEGLFVPRGAQLFCGGAATQRSRVNDVAHGPGESESELHSPQRDTFVHKLLPGTTPSRPPFKMPTGKQSKGRQKLGEGAISVIKTFGFYATIAPVPASLLFLEPYEQRSSVPG